MTELHDAYTLVLRAALTTLPLYGGQRAIFAADQVPGDCPRPYVTIYGPVGARDFDTKTGPTGSEHPLAGAGHVVVTDINVYANKSGDPSIVDGFAWQILQALNRQPNAINAYLTSWRAMIVRAAAPVIAETDESIFGRSVSVSATLRPR